MPLRLEEKILRTLYFSRAHQSLDYATVQALGSWGKKVKSTTARDRINEFLKELTECKPGVYRVTGSIGLPRGSPTYSKAEVVRMPSGFERSRLLSLRRQGEYHVTT